MSYLFLISVVLLGSFPFLFIQNVNAQQNSGADNLEPTLQLLGAGARWAAREGNSVLYVNWKDNWLSHHSTDGIDWYYDGTTKYMDDFRISITKALNYAHFTIDYAGDILNSLTNYDLVLINAFFAAEPHHAQTIRDYINGGGAVVLLGGVPCFFSVYCKDNWPYRLEGDDLSSIQDWFGAKNYWNTDGSASIVDDNPFGTSFSSGDVIYSTGGSGAFVHSLSNTSEVIAKWDSDYASGSPFLGFPYSYSEKIFAFTHEFGNGRLYYQAHFELDTDEDVFINPVSVEIDPKLDLQPVSGISQTTIKGTGFEPNSEVTVTWNGITMYTVPNSLQTDIYGNFTAMISVLNQTNGGNYEIMATDEMNNNATATFKVIPEFPSWSLVPILIIVSLVGIFWKKRIHGHTENGQTQMKLYAR